MTDEQLAAWQEAGDEEARCDITVVGGAYPDRSFLDLFGRQLLVGGLVAGLAGVAAVAVHSAVSLDRGWHLFLLAFASGFAGLLAGLLTDRRPSGHFDR